MFTFILKAFIITVFATIGYIVAAKISVGYVMKFTEEYVKMLNGEDE